MHHVVEAFTQLTSQQVIECLDKAPIANASVNDMHDVWPHPQLEERHRWTEIETPAGSIPALLPPGMNEARMNAIPRLGEHTEAILRELGYNEEAIARLRNEHAI